MLTSSSSSSSLESRGSRRRQRAESTTTDLEHVDEEDDVIFVEAPDLGNSDEEGDHEDDVFVMAEAQSEEASSGTPGEPLSGSNSSASSASSGSSSSESGSISAEDDTTDRSDGEDEVSGDSEEAGENGGDEEEGGESGEFLSSSDGDDTDEDQMEQMTVERTHFRRHRRRPILTLLCIPCMFLFSLFMLFMVLLFMGLPFCLFLLCLLSAYYCCTSDPLPPRVLLRALLDTDDWTANNGAGSGMLRRFSNKQQVEQELIQRMCLGTKTKSAQGADPTDGEDKDDKVDTDIGKSLQSVDRRHPGRVHWRYAEDDDFGDQNEEQERDEFDCLVFSEPLGDSNKSEIVKQVEEFNLPSTAGHQQASEKGSDQGPGEEPEATSTTEEPLPPICGASSLQPENDDCSASEQFHDATSVRERGAVCDICLINFESGDVIAWSTNPSCDHAFHSDCICDWLLRQPTCPSCRSEYLPVGAGTEGQDEDGVSSSSSSNNGGNSSSGGDNSADEGEDGGETSPIDNASNVAVPSGDGDDISGESGLSPPSIPTDSDSPEDGGLEP